MSKRGPWEIVPRTASIHFLDDDCILHVFYLYRPILLGEDPDDNARFCGGEEWDCGHWWYKLAHVCRRWRKVILDSASYLELSLVCTYGTPVADMLAHSPPLPLVLDYNDHEMTVEDEEGIILALGRRDRVRYVRLFIYDPNQNFQKLIAAIDGDYPLLEYLGVIPVDGNSLAMMLPETLHAPHLRHLTLGGLARPLGSRLITTAVGLVTLFLVMHPSTYFHPDTLVRWLSFMPQLEVFLINHSSSTPNHDIESQLMHIQIATPVTLPNLQRFVFHGVDTYLEAAVRLIVAPRLGRLEIRFFNQPTGSVPRLMQFINTTEHLRFDCALFSFSDDAAIAAFCPHEESRMFAVGIVVNCCHLDWQVSSVAQISISLSQMSSAVEYLILKHEVHSQSSEEHNEVDRIEWRKLLRSFSNVKKLLVDNGLVEKLSYSLELEDGELPLELLPELQELIYYGSSDTGDAFTSFIDARRNAGGVVTLVNL